MQELMGLIIDAGSTSRDKRRFSEIDSWCGKVPDDYILLSKNLGFGFEVDGRFLVQSIEDAFKYKEYHQKNLRHIHESDSVYFGGGSRISSSDCSRGDDEVIISNLMNWGSDDNGGMLFWDCVGSPDEWTIIATDCSGVWVRYHMNSIEYLYSLFSRNIECPVFTDRAWPSSKGIKITS